MTFGEFKHQVFAERKHAVVGSGSARLAFESVAHYFVILAV